MLLITFMYFGKKCSIFFIKKGGNSDWRSLVFTRTRRNRTWLIWLCVTITEKKNLQQRLPFKGCSKHQCFAKAWSIFCIKKEFRIKNTLLSNGQFYFPFAIAFVSYNSLEILRKKRNACYSMIKIKDVDIDILRN